jgi:hypothetical protein
VRAGLPHAIEADYIEPDEKLRLPENIAVRDIPKIITGLRKQMHELLLDSFVVH